MSKKPWEDKVSDEELEEVVDADFLDDEDEFEDYEEEEDVTPSDEKREKGGGFINSSFLTVLLGSSIVVQSGEGAGSIAARAGISVDELERLNPDHMTNGYWYANPGDVVNVQ